MIKKISLLSLFLVWGIALLLVVAPSVFADEPESGVPINVIVVDGPGSEGQTLNTSFMGNLGTTIDIDPSGLEVEGLSFAFFIHNGVKIANPSQQFLVSGSTQVVLVLKEAGEFVAAYVDTNGYLLDVQYGEELFEPEFDGDEPTKPGYEFLGWSFDGEVTEDIVITAVYELDAADVTVTVDGEPEEYAYNELVTLTSELEGFTHWEDENGFIVSYSNPYTFSALEDISLTAETGGTEAPLVYLRDVTGISTLGDSFIAQVHLPTGYTLVEWGFLGSNEQHLPELDDEDTTKMVHTAIHPVTKEFLRTVKTENDFAFIRAYAIVFDGEDYDTLYTLVRNKVDIEFTFIKSNWDGYPEDGDNGVYVTGHFNGWSLDNKLTKHTDIIPGQSHFIGVIQFSWIGGTYHVAFKFRHITPPDWSDQEWFGGEWRSPEDWYNIYGIVASGWEDWLVLSIDPSDGPSQTN